MSKILITGASGFVGSFLVEEALKQGLNVYAGVRKTSSRTYLQDKRIQFFELDFKNPSKLEKDLIDHKFDYIIHNAGVTATPKKETYFEVNRDYLETFVEILERSNIVPKKFIFISSLAAYGPADHQPEGIVKVNSTPHPVTNYGRSKLAAEKYLLTKKDFPWLAIRPTAVYGPRERDLYTVFKTIKSHLELYVGFKPQQLTFIYVKDLCKVVIDSLFSDQQYKGYFVSDGNTYSSELFNNLIKQELNKSTIKLKIPVGLIRIIAFLSEFFASLRGNYPPLNVEKVNELECKSWKCDIEPLKSDIGFTPKYDLQKGVKETVLWYKENNWL